MHVASPFIMLVSRVHTEHSIWIAKLTIGVVLYILQKSHMLSFLKSGHIVKETGEDFAILLLCNAC